MRNLLNKATGAAIAIAAAEFVLAPHSAPAQGIGPAIVTNDGVCFVLDASAFDFPNRVFLDSWEISEGFHITQSKDRNGNISLHCTVLLPDGAILPGDPDSVYPNSNRAVFWDFDLLEPLVGAVDAACCLNEACSESTTDWQNVVTKSGRSNLSCHFNASSE